MTRIFIICLLAGSMSLAQSPASGAQKKQPSQPAVTPSQPTQPSSLKREGAAPVAPNQPVLTVHGVCPADPKAATQAAVPAASQCAVQVTKADFDKLIDAFTFGNAPATQAQRRQMGQAYVELLTFSEAAKAAGVETNPAFLEVMRVIRLKTMSDFYRNLLTEEYRNPSQQEIEDNYKSNAAKYEGAKLARIYLPKNNPDPQATAEQKEAYQKKVQQLADDIQARAAKGEPVDKLQKEAYTTLGIASPPPSTDLNTARRGIFPPKLDQEIFSHKAGDVFRSDDGNGYMIYRVEDRQPLPLAAVKEEITREISRRKLEEKIKELTAPVHADFNENYFGPPPVPTPGRPIPNPAR
jgi:hypothetical protein